MGHQARRVKRFAAALIRPLHNAWRSRASGRRQAERRIGVLHIMQQRWVAQQDRRQDPRPLSRGVSAAAPGAARRAWRRRDPARMRRRPRCPGAAARSQRRRLRCSSKNRSSSSWRYSPDSALSANASGRCLQRGCGTAARCSGVLSPHRLAQHVVERLGQRAGGVQHRLKRPRPCRRTSVSGSSPSGSAAMLQRAVRRQQRQRQLGRCARRPGRRRRRRRSTAPAPGQAPEFLKLLLGQRGARAARRRR